jgi:epoxyqueuosine reductase QueG
MIDNIDMIQPKIADILNMTNREFKQKNQETAIGWRGLAVLKRNATIAAANIAVEKNKNELGGIQ